MAPLLAAHDPIAQSDDVLLHPLDDGHLLGTDSLGRDLYARLLYGSRTILVTSTASVCLAVLLGLWVGLVAGYRRGVAEIGLLRLTDVLLSFPLMLLGIMVVAALGSAQHDLVLAITVGLWPIVTRFVHSLTLREVSREYVLAARAVGMRPARIITREILPNVAPAVIVQATSLFALAASFSAALSYLGLGVTPPTADWGVMVKEGQPYIHGDAHLALVPGIAITLLLTAITFIGDDLRDLLQPGRRPHLPTKDDPTA